MNAFPEQEESLRALWERLLGSPVVEKSNFFLCGGDSLAGALLLEQIHAHFSVRLNLIVLYRYPTFGQFAAYLAAELNQRPAN
ncbi:acyl carrier protein [Nonomuraea sp. MG754425]|uniref:acyl carrier protein n=1 Tax=Nonomuraea sp. MG754425 TaxID=2570319 RepID=UPI001F1986D4|nr:acyl carrier protein [Nonomuraea sp. MG754425]